MKNQIMTEILTKQNARDKALIGGNSTPTTNGEFETLHVKGDAETLMTLEIDDYNILEIAFEASTDYDGDLFEYMFPSNMNLSNGIISMSNGK